MTAVVLVHNLTRDDWYLTLDGDTKPITPLCSTREQLRWMLGQFCFAVNGQVVEVTNDSTT